MIDTPDLLNATDNHVIGIPKKVDRFGSPARLHYISPSNLSSLLLLLSLQLRDLGRLMPFRPLFPCVL